jgi:hypothetical protein
MESSTPNNMAIPEANRPIQDTQDIRLEGVELFVIHKFGIALLMFTACVLVLLWSRNQVQQTKQALSLAQLQYDKSIKEQQLLELELNMLLAPAAIEQQVHEWDLSPSITVIDIYESKGQ